MDELRTVAREYARIVLNVLLEGIAFLVPAVILAVILQIVVAPLSEMFPLAPGGVAVVAFSVAFSKNYCFLEEAKYGRFVSNGSDSEESTLSDFADA